MNSDLNAESVPPGVAGTLAGIEQMQARIEAEQSAESVCRWCRCDGFHAEDCEGFEINDPARTVAARNADTARPNGSPAGPVTEGSTPPSPLALTGEAPGPAGDPDDDEAGLDEDISRVEAAFEKLGEMLRIDGLETG